MDKAAEKALEREAKNIATSLDELEQRFNRRRANKEANESRPQAEEMPRRADRPFCGARCKSRNHEPCRARVVVMRDAEGRVRIRTRCKVHGGLSTGPRTEEGRQRTREGFQRWLERRAQERSSQ